MRSLKRNSAVIVMVLVGFVSACEPAQESNDGAAAESAGQFVGTWTGPDGRPASDGDPVWDDELIVQTGSDHCGWKSVVFMSGGWPPGTTYGGGDGERRDFIRDAEGMLPQDRFEEGLQLDVELPDDSVATGYWHDGIELWLGPDRGDEAVYLVTDERVERWPRATEPVVCD